MSPIGDHGNRRRYQRDRCRCPLCRAANAAYQAQLRQQRARGKAPLGAYVRASATRALVRSLHAEHVTNADLGRRLGLQRPFRAVHADVVRLRTALRIRLVCRVLLAAE